MSEKSDRSAAPRTVVERYLEEVLNGHGPATAQDLISSEAFRGRVRGFREAFPDLRVTTHLLIADGEFVGVHASGRATHRGIFQGVPPTGRSWTASCTALYRVESGKISDFWVNWDNMSILEQLEAVRRAAEASA